MPQSININNKGFKMASKSLREDSRWRRRRWRHSRWRFNIFIIWGCRWGKISSWPPLEECNVYLYVHVTHVISWWDIYLCQDLTSHSCGRCYNTLRMRSVRCLSETLRMRSVRFCLKKMAVRGCLRLPKAALTSRGLHEGCLRLPKAALISRGLHEGCPRLP